MPKPALYYTDTFLEHKTGDHAERPERLTACMEYLDARGALDSFTMVAPRPANLSDLTRFHSGAYVERIRTVTEAGGGELDPDTPVSRGSFDAAVLAAGAAVDAAERVLAGKAPSAFAMVRPPGHHATRDQGMGFCLFNNVAIAAKHLLDACGVRSLAILDFDCHHGNGTEDAFRDDPRAVFVSFHRFPFYPGSGGPTQLAANPAHIVDVPLPYDTPPEEYHARWKEALDGSVRPAKPEIILVSAGFDCFKYDPIGGLGFEIGDYRRLGESIAALAADVCGGKLVSVLEGGYDLDALPRCVEAYLEGTRAIKRRG